MGVCVVVRVEKDGGETLCAPGRERLLGVKEGTVSKE